MWPNLQMYMIRMIKHLIDGMRYHVDSLEGAHKGPTLSILCM